MYIGEFVDTYPPEVDGVGRVTQAYCSTLCRMGHQAYYVAPQSPGAKNKYDFPLVLSGSLAFPGELFRVGVPALDKDYRRQLDSIPFDIVHAHSPFLAWSEASRIAKKRDIPLVSTFHSKYRDDVRAKMHSSRIAELAVKGIVKQYEKTDAVWTLNNATADVLRDYGYRGKLLIMPNGTNIEPLQPAARDAMVRKLHLPLGDKVLLFVGQHNYKKNLHGVLNACKLILEQGGSFQLILVGDGPDFDAIVQESKELGLGDRCHFMGFMQDRASLMALYDMADLFVFPSLYDNAPMVLREAASMGTPAVLVKGSCSAEGVEDGVNGYISLDESGRAIADTIIRALPTVKTVGEVARRTIPISWRSIMDQVLKEYDRLINGKR